MFCVKCGHSLSDADVVCPKCGTMVNATGSSETVPTHLVGAILATIFCCVPLGIVAIVYAAQVNGKVAAGDIAGARHNSKMARTWIIASMSIGFVVMAIYIGIAMLNPETMLGN
jgi:uncharacterized membrane protein YvbJ